MYFCDIKNRKSKELIPGLHVQTFWGEKSTLITVNLDPGAHVPPHSHHHEQCGTVIAGEITFVIGGESRTLQPGACYIIPGHVEHSATAGDKAVKLVELFTPVREEYHYE